MLMLSRALKPVQPTLESGINNKHTPTLIDLLTFFQGLRPYSGLHRASFSSISSIRCKWGYAYSFCQIFHRLRLFKGLCLFQTLEYLHSNSTQILALKKSVFSEKKNSSPPKKFFFLPFSNATFQCRRYGVFKKKKKIFFWPRKSEKTSLKSCS